MLRLLGEYDMTKDVFKLLYASLQDVRHTEIDMKDHVRPSRADVAGDVLVNKVYLEHLEKLTHASLKPIGQQPTDKGMPLVRVSLTGDFPHC